MKMNQILTSVLLGFFITTGCRSTVQRPFDEYKTDLSIEDASGDWVGTYHQYNFNLSFPMHLTLDVNGANEMEVTMRWPSFKTTTSGRGKLSHKSISWTELELTDGREGIMILDGSFKAYLREDGVFEGRYSSAGSRETGASFELRRLY